MYIHPWNEDTSVIRTLLFVPRVSEIERFHCNAYPVNFLIIMLLNKLYSLFLHSWKLVYGFAAHELLTMYIITKTELYLWTTTTVIMTRSIDILRWLLDQFSPPLSCSYYTLYTVQFQFITHSLDLLDNVLHDWLFPNYKLWGYFCFSVTITHCNINMNNAKIM